MLSGKSKGQCWLFFESSSRHILHSFLPCCALGSWVLWTASSQHPCHMTSFESFQLKALVSSSEDRKRDIYCFSCSPLVVMALVELPSNAPGQWPSSMLQNLSRLHYHVPASAFPLGVGSLLLPVTGGFIHLCCSHFCSCSENIPSLNSFQLNPFVLPSVSCWDWQNLFEEIINVYQRT